MKKIDSNELFTKTDMNTGENIFYEDSELKIPFNGIAVDYFKGKLNWEFEVKNGFITGTEKVYYETGELKEENEMDHNTINGISREFYKNGNLRYVSIVIRNIPIQTICFNENGDVIDEISINENDSTYFAVKKDIDKYLSKYNLDKYKK